MRWMVAIALLAAGCVPAQKAPPAVVEASPPVAPPAPAAAVARTPAIAPEPIAPPIAPPEAPKTPAKAPAKPTAKAPPAKVQPAPAPPPAAAPTPPTAAPAPLDLKALEQRLKQTDAIGVMTKLSLKNQVDDLVDQFRAYYAGRTKASLAELRRPYEMLLMKVLTLLQDGDPSLAQAVNASREAIWGILSDREKFSRIS
jgi:outer membrane biosynthesis protein TonB